MKSSEVPRTQPAGDITVLLRQASARAPGVHAKLVEMLYPEIKRLAEFRMKSERPDHTLQATALVSEFFLEMARAQGITWRDRTHFLAVASQAMRRFLIDYARGRNADRRGGGRRPIEFEMADIAGQPCDLATIGELLDRLASEEPRMAQIVDMRCFGGLTHSEIGEALDLDERTIKRDWRIAKAWLTARLQKRVAGDER
jgi:RNA polymerase sigma-70 factor (ECF subfamily)